MQKKKKKKRFILHHPVFFFSFAFLQRTFVLFLLNIFCRFSLQYARQALGTFKCSMTIIIASAMERKSCMQQSLQLNPTNNLSHKMWGFLSRREDRLVWINYAVQQQQCSFCRMIVVMSQYVQLCCGINLNLSIFFCCSLSSVLAGFTYSIIVLCLASRHPQNLCESMFI